ncbi:MAG: hypothetical protein EP298_00555 [Gammaproteobacteria bacterium]|nr:MAG: hypothetical protein EP298_00555 [Gammaproteobacteria bacterium]UTW41890.1 hypothetical protein KFE69_10300 [bacterium SCSIO 12844]
MIYNDKLINQAYLNYAISYVLYLKNQNFNEFNHPIDQLKIIHEDHRYNLKQIVKSDKWLDEKDIIEIQEFLVPALEKLTVEHMLKLIKDDLSIIHKLKFNPNSYKIPEILYNKICKNIESFNFIDNYIPSESYQINIQDEKLLELIKLESNKYAQYISQLYKSEYTKFEEKRNYNLQNGVNNLISEFQLKCYLIELALSEKYNLWSLIDEIQILHDVITGAKYKKCHFDEKTVIITRDYPIPLFCEYLDDLANNKLQLKGIIFTNDLAIIIPRKYINLDAHIVLKNLSLSDNNLYLPKIIGSDYKLKKLPDFIKNNELLTESLKYIQELNLKQWLTLEASSDCQVAILALKEADILLTESHWQKLENINIQKALRLAFDYYSDSKDKKEHGENGRKQTVTFIKNILNLHNITSENIKEEMVKWVEGYGLFSPSSNLNDNSRIRYVYNSDFWASEQRFETLDPEMRKIKKNEMLTFFKRKKEIKNDLDKKDHQREELVKKIKKLKDENKPYEYLETELEKSDKGLFLIEDESIEDESIEGESIEGESIEGESIEGESIEGELINSQRNAKIDQKTIYSFIEYASKSDLQNVLNSIPEILFSDKVDISEKIDLNKLLNLDDKNALNENIYLLDYINNLYQAPEKLTNEVFLKPDNYYVLIKKNFSHEESQYQYSFLVKENGRFINKNKHTLNQLDHLKNERVAKLKFYHILDLISSKHEQSENFIFMPEEYSEKNINKDNSVVNSYH